MAMAIVSWDLPPRELMGAYEERARTDWVPTVLRQPGVEEFRALRNAFRTSPQAMTITVYDSLAAALRFPGTEDFARVMEDMRAAGCTNVTMQLWDVSPLVPEPLRPAGR
ncbi:MAG: hypothetical protein KatS3mg014_0622 [Actinomycetota bacterium]|nr:MAG: hypothetical protein KatS3mg014_0622 [Actinomycetota bacterium]